MTAVFCKVITNNANDSGYVSRWPDEAASHDVLVWSTPNKILSRVHKGMADSAVIKGQGYYSLHKNHQLTSFFFLILQFIFHVFELSLETGAPEVNPRRTYKLHKEKTQTTQPGDRTQVLLDMMGQCYPPNRVNHRNRRCS